MPLTSDERSPVELLADEFLARCKRGEKATIKEYCDRHPSLADEIRDVFEAMLMVEDLKPGSDEAGGSLGESAPGGGKRLQQVGDYRILCEIGRGGMGVVYEAEQQALGRRVALKVLPRTIAGNGSAQIRFQREAKAAARMHHTNIVPVFDVGQDGEHLYYAMQLIHGQALDLVIDDLKRLRAQGGAPSPLPLSPEYKGEGKPGDRSIAASLAAGKFERENLAPEAETDPNATGAYEGSAPASALLPGQSEISTVTSNRGVYFRSVAHIGLQTASALSYAHSRGIIHRDIKPGNLILDTTGNVWVTDFGLAKTGDGGVTNTGDILGTIRYMSPERFRGQCDVRADVYALGMTLYEMLTLKAAYASGDHLKLIDLIRHTEAASPRSLDGRVPLDLETIVMKAIDKDPKRRYQSADEMGEDLQRFVNDEPIKARRVGSLERLGRWCRRNPLPASLLAAMVLVFLAGFTAVSWQWRVAEAARADEESQRGRAQEAQRETAGALATVATQKAEVERSLFKAEAAEEAGRKLLYTTDMQLVPFLWRDDRTTADQLRAVLARHIPRNRAAGNALGAGLPTPPVEGLKPDLRGFEWHYYQHVLDHSATVFSGHGAAVADGAFTSDGQLVTLDEKGRVRRWDLSSQHELEANRRDLPGGASAQVRILSPNGRLAALAIENKVHVFDAATGKEAFSIDSASGRRRLVFSRDSNRLVIVDNKIRWCSTVNGEEIASLNEELGPFNSLALSADGLTLAVVGLPPVGMKFSSFRLDPTGKSVTALAKDVVGSGSKIASALSPDGKSVAVSYLDGAMNVFETATGGHITGRWAHPALIVAMAFSDDGAKLATADDQGTIKIWAGPQKQTSESAPLLTLKGHRGANTTIRFSSDGKRLLTSSADKTARVWDLENPDPAVRTLERYAGPLNVEARFSPDGRLIAGPGNGGVAGGSVYVWDAVTGRLLRDLRDVGGPSYRDVYSVAFSPTDSRLLAAGCGRADGSFVSLWDIDTGTKLARLPAATNQHLAHSGVFRGMVCALAFSPDGKYLVAGFGQRHLTTRAHSPNPLKVWEVATRRPIRLLNGHTGYCTSLAFSKDGTLLASSSRDGTAIIWSTEIWKPLHTLHNRDRGAAGFDDLYQKLDENQRFVECVAFSPDGKTLAMASYRGTVQLWDVATGKLLARLTGHASPVRAVVFSPDGRTLASGGTDRTVRLWNVETRRELMQLDPGRLRLGGVQSLDFSPDGKQLLAAGGNAAVWSTAPIVWNDSDQAAEKLWHLLQSSPDFQIRIRMLSENPRLQGTLEKLEKLAPNDVRVQTALAVARARRFAAEGNVHLADTARAQARRLLEERLAQEPEDSACAVELADPLLIGSHARWSTLKPVEAKSDLGATLSILPDDSILASGANLHRDRYRVVLTVSKDIDLAAVRLDALTHASLPGNGPGRDPRGTFAQRSWKVTATSPKRKDPITLKFHNAWADHDYAKPPITTNGQWNIATIGDGRNCAAIWSLPKPAFLAAGTRMTFEMEFWGIGPQNLGHFHLSVSSDPQAIDRLAATQLTDPWAKLAAAYHVIGAQAARDTVVKHHPAAAAGVGDVYTAEKAWERAIAEYRKAVTDQPADVALLTKLAAAYQGAGRTREAIPYMASASAAKPEDTLLAVKVAALQAWFGQEQELAATRKRILAFAKGTDNAGRANDAARICSLAPATDAGELEAALALAHTGAKLKRNEWTLLSAGISEYRSGNYAAADETLVDAANANANNRTVQSTAAFYRAMNLFRQAKQDEARKLAIAAAANMKPLPKDEQNPLAGGATHDDLILWLAYKEAKAMIKLDDKTVP